LNFKDFLTQVEKIRSNQANYQPVLICFLSNSKNQQNTQQNIAEKLAVMNGKPKGDFKPFMGSCPVYKVLLGKSLLVKKGDVYKLNIAIMTASQKKQISKLCMEMLN
jgi:hypothetical protein